MLAGKDEELDKLKGRSTSTQSSSNPSPGRNKNEQLAEFSHDPTAAIFANKKLTPNDREQLNQDYVKNVFIKYLEY